jgi:hypothetical protein
LRQLEGKTLEADSAPASTPNIPKYDGTKQGGALAAVPKAYNTDADVVVEVRHKPRSLFYCLYDCGITRVPRCVLLAWCWGGNVPRVSITTQFAGRQEMLLSCVVGGGCAGSSSRASALAGW